MPLSITTSYAISKPEIIREQFDEEVVIVDLDTGSYYSLGGAGGEVWSAIESGASSAQIVERLVKSYHAEHAEIEASVARLLEELLAEELIVPQTGAGNPVADIAATGDEAPRRDWQAPILQKFTDMQALLLLDPIHEVDSAGWPQPKPEEPVMAQTQSPPTE